MAAFTVSVESAVDDGMVTVHVAGTVADATSGGLFHPSCRHSLSAYLPGATKVPTHTADPQGDAARQRLRDLERRVRKQRLLAEAAIDPVAGKEHAAKARVLQGQIREHVAATRDMGIMRKPERERPDLGFSPSTAKPAPAPKPPKVPKPTAPSFDDQLKAAAAAGDSREAAPINVRDQIRNFADQLGGFQPSDVESALGRYRGIGYKGINDALRASGGAETSSSAAPLIDAAMRASRLTRDVATYRYIDDAKLTFGSAWPGGGDATGIEWTDHAYVSTSPDGVLVRHMSGGNGKGAMLRILAPKGTGAVGMRRSLSAPDTEKELLLERGLKYRIVKDHGVSAEDGRRVLDVEVVPARVNAVKAPEKSEFPLSSLSPIRPAATVRTALSDAATKKELRDVIKAEIKRIGGPYSLTVDTSFTAGDLQTAREHAEGILRGMERFPKTPLAKIEASDAPAGFENAYAWAGSRMITFNKAYTRTADRDNYLATLDRSVAGWETMVKEYGHMVPGTGFHPRGTNTPIAIAVHEFGHSVDIEGLYHGIKGKLETLLSSHAAGKSIRNMIEKQVSQYALKSREELVAEAFADEIMNGENASPLSRGIFKLLEDEYKERYG